MRNGRSGEEPGRGRLIVTGVMMGMKSIHTMRLYQVKFPWTRVVESWLTLLAQG